MKLTFVINHELRAVRADAAVGGAFATCWVVANDLAEARQRVDVELLGAGWRILTTTDERLVRRDSLAHGTERYFDQAQLDGVVAVLDAFPLDPPDG